MATRKRQTKRLPRGLPNRPILQQALREYRACPTYWYIPKARTLNDENIRVCAQMLTVISERFEGSKWDQITQSALLTALSQEHIIEPRVSGGQVQDRNALSRIIKTLLETLGLIWVFEDHELVITDMGEGLRVASSERQRRELIQTQIAKFQYPNPIVNSRLQRGFAGIVPLLFLLDILRRVENTLTVEEFELFVNLATSQGDAERIADYVSAWRSLDRQAQRKVLSVFQDSAMAKIAPKQAGLSDAGKDGLKGPSRWCRVRRNSS